MSTNYYWWPEDETSQILQGARNALARMDDPYARLAVQSLGDYLTDTPYSVDDDNPAIHIGRYSNAPYDPSEGREVLVLNSDARAQFRWTRKEHRVRLEALLRTEPHRGVLADEYGQIHTAAMFFSQVLAGSPTEVVSPGRWS